MIIPPRDPNNPKSIHTRTLIIVVLLAAAAALASMSGLYRNVETEALKQAEKVCGEGNVVKTGESTYTCADGEEGE